MGAIGNTPLVRMDRFAAELRGGQRAKLKGESREDMRDIATDGPQVWAKLEQFNPGGSAKDRTAWAMIEKAKAHGDIADGATLVESSSGNLGMALSRLAIINGWDFHCVVDPRVNAATVATMKAFGARVHMLEHLSLIHI